jgi:uncharacterized protein YkwD/LysM repeat protein
MQKRFLTTTLLLLTLLLIGTSQAHATSTPQEATAQDVINAVNELRIANGLNPLSVHPALMQAAQWEANAIASGLPGHSRPNGLTLGQWLISLGYPLSGDLSQDGYRSENWVAARSAEEAIQLWLMDAPHTNTMLSPDRSDIGAAIAVGDQTYIVIETALQTANGEMQTDAKDMLTALPYDETGSLAPQFIMPVIVSTARPDGDVIHKVAYGQSLWSIAIAYNTTIEQIRAWNNLDADESVYENEILLVQKAATQPGAATVTAAGTAGEVFLAPPATFTPSLPPTSTPTNLSATQPAEKTANPAANRAVLIIVMVFALIVGGWLAMSMRMPEER